MPEQPKQLGVLPKEPVIYTIPDQFYGLAAKAQLPKEVAAPAAASSSSAPVQTPGAVPPPAPAEKGSKAWILIPILAVLFLIGAGFAAWWFLRPKKPAATVQPSVTLPTTTKPQPQPEPTPEPEPEPTPEPATTTEEVPAAPAPSADEDGDGLTTAEETLFGTDAKKTDSDDDGFSDSVEVTNLYNPAGFRPTRLIEAGQVKNYDGEDYQILQPTAWTVRASDDPKLPGAVEILSAEGTRTIIAPNENPENQSVLDWYMSRNPEAAGSRLETFTTKSGLEGVRTSPMQVYIAVGAKIYQLTLVGSASEATLETMLYRTTFTMMTNSFSAKL